MLGESCMLLFCFVVVCNVFRVLVLIGGRVVFVFIYLCCLFVVCILY